MLFASVFVMLVLRAVFRLIYSSGLCLKVMCDLFFLYVFVDMFVVPLVL